MHLRARQFFGCNGRFRPLLALLLLSLTLLLVVARAPARAAAPILAAAVEEGGVPIYGVNFISSAELLADAQQYANGLATGAQWNRWPIYWFNIEQSPGYFDWSRQDAAVAGDVTHGLRTNAILLGTPPFYTTAGAQRQGAQPAPQPIPRPGTLALYATETAKPAGLDTAVFSDGSDRPGPGKTINPENKWALFVYTAVNRYKPGGALARASSWPPSVGVTHWEMWNEPDLNIFWDASVEAYARLLKVGYLAARQADPNAVILFGALANNVVPSAGHTNIYRQIMALYDADPLAAEFGYFHDVLATHSYFVAWNSWLYVFQAERTLAARGLQKPIWLNENGVPAWDDYPGPTWDPNSSLRATLREQADYVIQSAFYATYAGADAIFHFQLYDGCGNQALGSDFPPHSGELCTPDGKLVSNPALDCAGDANGLFRNPTDAQCFRQHPQPETPRPNFAAFQILTTHFRDVTPYWRQRPGETTCFGPGFVEVRGQEWIAFYRYATQERIVGMWTLCGEDETAVVPATNPAGTALLVTLDPATNQIVERTLTAENGVYTIELPAATNRNPFPFQDVNPIYPIGGRPFILIEPDDRQPPPELDQRWYLPLIVR